MKKTVLIINNNGKVNQVLDDDYMLCENIEYLLDSIARKNYSKYFSLMNQLTLGKTINNLSLLVNVNNTVRTFFINAYKKSEGSFVFFFTSKIIDDEIAYNKILQNYGLNYDLIAHQKIKKDNDELIHLNRKLINIQNEFSQANYELKNLNIQLKSIIESIQEYLVLVDLDGEIIISNSNYNDFYNKEKNVFRFIKNNNKYLYEQFMDENHYKEYLCLNDIKLKSHIDRYFDVKIVPIYDDEGEKKYFVITFDDVTKRMKNIRRLRNLKMAFDQSKENIAITDTNYKITFANQSFISEYGFSKESEVLERDIRELTERIEKPEENELVDREIYYNQRRGGELFPVEISKSEVELGKEVISYIYFIKNITEQLDYEEKLILMAKKDQMTGTYSREAGITYLDDYLSNETSSTDEVSILFLDVNALKQVNDNFGHQSGDELINQIVEVINESTRTNDIVSRLGGDEFLIILPDSDRDNAEMIKKRIIEDTKNRNKTKEYLVSVSIGTASSNEIDEKDAEDLINLADHRMYKEKEKFYETHETKKR